MDPLVSVIVTNFNYGMFIQEAIESVLAQTYKNIELVVIDDGSTDNSQDVLQKIRKRHRFKFVAQTNGGTVEAKLRGIEESSGEYFLHLDADDRLDRNCIRELVNALRDSNAAYAYPVMEYFGAKSGMVPSQGFNARLLVFKGSYISGSSLVRRSDYQKTPGYRQIEAFEDWDVWLSFLDIGLKGIYVPGAKLWYRQHEGGRNSMTLKKYTTISKGILTMHPKSVRRYYVQDVPRKVTNKLRRLAK